MEAELYNKGVKTICGRQNYECWGDIGANACVLLDRAISDCCAAPSYCGNKNPVPIVEQWLEEHPEPVKLPELPEKLNPVYLNHVNINDKINAIIDYLAAREEKEEKNEPKK